MTGVDPVTIIVGVASGLGVIGAGLGIWKFAAQYGATQTKTNQAMETFIATMPAAVAELSRQREAMERQAKAAEENAKWIPLMQAMQEEKHDLGLTLRSMARKINTLMRTNELSDDDKGS